jgi:hypothetical protein
MNVVARKPADRHVMWKVKGRKRNRDYRTREHLTQDEHGPALPPPCDPLCDQLQGMVVMLRNSRTASST